MGTEILHYQSPEVIEKETAMNLLVYNLIRANIAQTAFLHDKKPRELSFRASVQLIHTESVRLLFIQKTVLKQMLEHLLLALASKMIGNR